MKRSHRLLFALLLAAGPVRAEPSTAPGSTGKARALFQSGLALAQQGDLSGALREFEAAYAARPHYSVLYNIAQTHAALGHPVEAVATFQRYLADGGKLISEARRGEVQSLIAVNRQRIGRLRINGGTAATRAWLDGRELSADERNDVISLAKGEHSLVFWDGSASPESRTLAVTSDDLVELMLPAPPPAPSAPAPLTHLAVSCSVPDIDVEVLGTGAFKTPQREPLDVPVGELSLRFSRAGYPTLERSLLTMERELAQIDCEERPLSPVPARLSSRLSLALSPADADVFVDGRAFVGEALPAGLHQLRVEHDGFVAFERRISLEPGRTQLHQLVLAPTARERDRQQRARNRAQTTALILGGLGLGVLAASAGVYAWNSGRYDAWQDKRQRGTATPDDAARIQRGDDAALGLLLAGGVLGMSSTWFYFTAP